MKCLYSVDVRPFTLYALSERSCRELHLHSERSRTFCTECSKRDDIIGRQFHNALVRWQRVFLLFLGWRCITASVFRHFRQHCALEGMRCTFSSSQGFDFSSFLFSHPSWFYLFPALFSFFFNVVAGFGSTFEACICKVFYKVFLMHYYKYWFKSDNICSW